MRLYLIPAIGRIQLSALTPQHVQAMMNGMAERGLSPRSVQYARTILRRALSQALRWGQVARNVAALTDPPRVVHPDVRMLDADESARFLVAVRGDRLEAFYTVALALGLRQAEALGLRWEDVDLDVGVLRVRVALQQLKGQPVQLVEPKTKQSRRTLSLPKTLVTQLRAHRTRQLEERLKAGVSWQGERWRLVFCTPTGEPLSKWTVFHQFKRHVERAGLPDMRFHDLRHSCASFLVAQGLHPRMVMETLGHSTITLTMNVYSHVMPQSQRKATDLMDGLLGRVAEVSA